MPDADSPEPALSTPDGQLVQHIALALAILDERRRTEKRSVLDRLLEPGIIIALITVLGGGIVGSYLTISWQARAKQRELLLTQFQQETDARLKAVTAAYDLEGDAISAADDLLTLLQWRFAANGQMAQEESGRIAIRFNTAEDQWRKTRGRVGLLLAYHHGAAPQTIQAWAKVESATDSYLECASTAYDRATPISSKSGEICGVQRFATDSAILELANALEAVRKTQLKATLE